MVEHLPGMYKALWFDPQNHRRLLTLAGSAFTEPQSGFSEVIHTKHLKRCHGKQEALCAVVTTVYTLY